MRDYAVRHDENSEVRHEHHHEGATRCAREGRARASGRALLVALLAMLVVFVTPAPALAAGGGVIWGPSDVPGGGRAVVVNADDQFTAAAMALGYSYSEIQAWSPEIKAKLSNASTGGAFYSFVQLFNRYNDAIDLDGPIGTIVEAVGSAFFAVAETLFGGDIWFAGYDDDTGLSAAWDLKMILQGEDIGGGGSGGSGGTGTDAPLEIPFIPLVATWYTGSPVMKIGGVDYYLAYSGDETATKMKAPNPFTIKLPSDVYSNVPEGDYVFAYSFLPRLNGSNIGGSIQITAVPADSYTLRPNERFPQYNMIVPNEGTHCYTMYVNSLNISTNYLGADLSNVTFGKSTVTYGTANTLGATGYAKYFYDTLQSVGGGGGGDPVIPPTNWPEPEAPEPPELPEPGDPVVEPPEPYEPTTGPTFIWNVTNTSEPTDTSDLLEWIKKIFYELKAIHSDLKTWFENLGDAISDGFEAMDNACGQIYDAITENTDELKNQFQALKTYLRQLFNWLGEKMNFQAAGYDDTSVIYWLKRIWSKLGNGDINVRPTDPTTDPTGVWDWLLKLIQNFLIGLASTTNDLISEFADLISQVMHQFPFSIPWDIAAFLAAFAAAPLTPEFDVNIPAIQGWWSELNFHIDLSPYDTAAATIRAIEKILFAAYLVWRSKDLLDFMDVSKWFNG